MTKENKDSSTLIDFFSHASHEDENPRTGKRSFPKKGLAIVGGIAVAAVAGIVVASAMTPQLPHAEQIGIALSKWSEENGRVEIPENPEYSSYFSYLKNLGPRSAEYGMPNFGKKSQDIMVKIVQTEQGGSPFKVCSYDMSEPKDAKSFVKEYTYYSFSSEAGPFSTEDPACIPNA